MSSSAAILRRMNAQTPIETVGWDLPLSAGFRAVLESRPLAPGLHVYRLSWGSGNTDATGRAEGAPPATPGWVVAGAGHLFQAASESGFLDDGGLASLRAGGSPPRLPVAALRAADIEEVRHFGWDAVRTRFRHAVVARALFRAPDGPREALSDVPDPWRALAGDGGVPPGWEDARWARALPMGQTLWGALTGDPIAVGVVLDRHSFRLDARFFDVHRAAEILFGREDVRLVARDAFGFHSPEDAATSPKAAVAQRREDRVPHIAAAWTASDAAYRDLWDAASAGLAPGKRPTRAGILRALFETDGLGLRAGGGRALRVVGRPHPGRDADADLRARPRTRRPWLLTRRVRLCFPGRGPLWRGVGGVPPGRGGAWRRAAGGASTTRARRSGARARTSPGGGSPRRTSTG